uniref:WbqC family protein n=1 Tax=candidate division WOR-3 bacterium TaxID=2052148 RepID=A0A7C4YSC9_UNCW3
MIKIGIHQPNFLPHTGFFKKLFLSDIFVILDDVQFSRRSFTQRTLIKYDNFAGWLTIPVLKKGRYYQLIKDTEIDNEREWMKMHLKTFYHFYRKARYFFEIYDILKEIYSKKERFLIDFNIRGIYRIKDYLGIDKKIVFSSEINVKGTKTDRIIQILKRLDGNVYVSGEGGKKYLDMDKMNENGFKVIFYERVKEYRQLGLGFIPGLSIIDLLFNEGKMGIEWIRG